MFVRKNRAKGQQRFGPAVHGRIVTFVTSVSVLNESVSADDLQALALVGGIDAGEGLLFVAAAHDPSALMATADHRVSPGTGECTFRGRSRTRTPLRTRDSAA